MFSKHKIVEKLYKRPNDIRVKRTELRGNMLTSRQSVMLIASKHLTEERRSKKKEEEKAGWKVGRDKRLMMEINFKSITSEYQTEIHILRCLPYLSKELQHHR